MNLGGNRELGTVLGELTAAGQPWLAIDLPGAAGRPPNGPGGGVATVVSLTDPGLPPVMVNPLEPEPGFGVQAHARRLAELIEAVFGLVRPRRGGGQQACCASTRTAAGTWSPGAHHLVLK